MRGRRSVPTRSAVSVATLVVGLVALAVAAALWVPWHPVPGGTPPAAPVGSVLTPDEVARAEAFARWARVWSWSGLAVSLLVIGWLGSSRRGGETADRLAARLPGPRWLRTVLLVLAVEGCVRLATLPAAAALHVHLRRAGLSTQGWGGWSRDVGVGWLVSTVPTVLGVLALLALVRRLPRAWPAVAGVLAAGLVVAGSFVYPLLVEPLFNSFTPLPAGPLRADVLRLAEAEHVHVDDVLVADASRRTSTLNAYVSGFGGSRRVVLYDTLLERPRAEVDAVVAHELAHARHDDVLHGTLIGAAGAVAAVGLLGLVLGGSLRRRAAAEIPARMVPRVLAVVAVGSFLALPLQNGVSRLVETRADHDALVTTGDPEAFVALQRSLALAGLADPDPPRLSQWWFGSHPTLLQRVGLVGPLADLPDGRLPRS